MPAWPASCAQRCAQRSALVGPCQAALPTGRGLCSVQDCNVMRQVLVLGALTLFEPAYAAWCLAGAASSSTVVHHLVADGYHVLTRHRRLAADSWQVAGMLQRRELKPAVPSWV